MPSWDWSARTWRRRTREVAWFAQSTPVHKRRCCVSRLMSRLTGPARLLAMSWSRMAFDSPEGARQFLQRRAASPLVRQTLPNAAAICSQYIAFQRRSQERIGNFLVRESLVHEEFCEAIIRPHEDRLGFRRKLGTLVFLQMKRSRGIDPGGMATAGGRASMWTRTYRRFSAC